MSHTEDSIEVPKTLSPWFEIFAWNGGLLALIYSMVAVLLYPFAKYGLVWAGVVTLAIGGILIAWGTFAADIPDWYATVAFNRLTKRRRSVFQGFHAKNFLEYLAIPFTPLKRELTAVKTVLLPTNDPTETMQLELAVHIRLDTAGNPERAARNLIQFQSVEEHTLEEIVFGEIKKMFAARYSDLKEGEMEKLLDARAVQKAVIEDDTVNHERVHELAEKYGVHIEVILESSNPDERTKKIKELPARAEGMRDAMAKLGTTGMDVDKQRTSALLLDDIAEYSETGISLDVKGLENLRNATVIPPGSLGLGGDKKKGGKK